MADHHISSSDPDPVAVDDIDELVDELPDNTPRYVLVTYSMVHDDGRRSNPLFLVYWIPRTASTEMSTLYVSSSWSTQNLWVGIRTEC